MIAFKLVKISLVPPQLVSVGFGSSVLGGIGWQSIPLSVGKVLFVRPPRHHVRSSVRYSVRGSVR